MNNQNLYSIADRDQSKPPILCTTNAILREVRDANERIAAALEAILALAQKGAEK